MYRCKLQHTAPPAVAGLFSGRGAQSGNALTIETSTNLDGLELQLFDIQGKNIRSYQFNGFGDTNKTTLSTSDVPAGMYFLKSFDSNRLFTQKIILQ